MITNNIIGHWCSFCQCYHSSVSCYHPGHVKIDRLEAENQRLRTERNEYKADMEQLAEQWQHEAEYNDSLKAENQRLRTQIGELLEETDRYKKQLDELYERINADEDLSELVDLRRRLETYRIYYQMWLRSE